jgi:hypothetical protein
MLANLSRFLEVPIEVILGAIALREMGYSVSYAV